MAVIYDTAIITNVCNPINVIKTVHEIPGRLNLIITYLLCGYGKYKSSKRFISLLYIMIHLEILDYRIMIY